jgi:endonuclease III related protein
LESRHQDRSERPSLKRDLLKVYTLLHEHFGDLHWWPAESPFEVMVGAILTQNTSWINVEKAISALKRRGLLSPVSLNQLEEDSLAEIIRPSGYFRVKAKRLKSLVSFLFNEYSGSIKKMQAENLSSLREKLIGVKGIGPETADSILLYACQKPVFVSDAYTQRILRRHGLIPEGADVAQIRTLLMNHLPHDVPFFNQFHALLVNAGKTYCRRIPKCASCPLGNLLQDKPSVRYR